MKTYVIHEVSSDKLATHIQVNDGHSQLLAVLPETVGVDHIKTVMTGVFSSITANAKFPAPSSSIVVGRKKGIVPHRGPVPLEKMIEILLDGNSTKAFTVDEIYNHYSEFSPYQKSSIQTAFNKLYREKRIHHNGTGYISKKL